MNVPAVAELLGLSEATIKRLISDGRLKAIRFAQGAYLVPADNLLSFDETGGTE